MILRVQRSTRRGRGGRVRKSIRMKSLSRSTIFRRELRANVCIGTTGEILRGVKSNRVLREVYAVPREKGASGRAQPLGLFRRYDGIRSRSSKLEISLVRLRRGVRLPPPPRIYFAHPNVSPPLSSVKQFRIVFQEVANRAAGVTSLAHL